MRVPRFVRALLIAFSLVSGHLLADSAWTIPGIVNAGGLNGTHFVSDLTVTNPGAAPANVTLSFFPAGSSGARSLTLNPGQTVVYSDVAGVTFGVSGGAGALSVSSDQPLLIRAKTYNTAASGTYGVALPVVSTDRLLSPGDVGDSLWITQDASGSTGYRTNIAVVFPDDPGGAAAVTVYDADGNELGSQDFSLDSAGLQQFSVGSFAGPVSIGRAQIAVTRGHASAYAVVVDNVTGDSSLFSFEDLPAGIQDVLVNGVARASGRNGAFFRTDGRFYNPTDTDATVTVAFHASGNANLSPQAASFVVPAGEIRDVVDVLSSLLNLPVGSAGALRFQSNWPVAILCRTSNVDPSGTRPGTFGSQQKPVPLLSFVMSADAGAAVTGIRQDAAFRTNVGFAAGADGASYALTLANAAGATVATTSASLGTFGWAQPAIQDLFPTTTIPENATLTVKVTAGSVDVFDSSIDNLSGDPVVTPIAALPAVFPSSATIGPAGGSIRSADGRLTLRVPAGALASPVSLSFQTTASGAPQAVGSGYQILPSGVSFGKPALLTFSYGAADIEGSSADALGLAVKTAAGWFVSQGRSTDTARRTCTVPLGATSSAARAAPPASRRAAMDPVLVWSVVENWVLVPSGPLHVLTEGHLTFAAYSLNPTGPPTGDVIPGGAFTPISSSPLEVEVTWYVNGIVRGDLANGTIASVGNNGVYSAPSCPPAQNPVTIRYAIANQSTSFVGVWSRGRAHVRVTPRKWKLTLLSAEFSWNCSPLNVVISDDIKFGSAGVDLVLDDAFHAEGAGSATVRSHAVAVCPNLCGGNKPGLPAVGTADSTLDLTVTADFGVTSPNYMDLSVDGIYRGLSGTVVSCTTPEGDTAEVPVSPLGSMFSFYGNLLRAEDGDELPGLPENLSGYGSITTHYRLDSLCP